MIDTTHKTQTTKRYTVTKGNSPEDLVTFSTDNFEDTKADAQYVSVRHNFAISVESIEDALCRIEK